MRNSLVEARQAFSADWPEATRQVQGRRWGLIRAGDSGPALVLLPGTLGRADIFWQQIAALHGEARILALSYPGAGSVAEWAEDIAALIDAFGLEGATVLGSSLGGYLAQYTTARHGALCGGLVAANTLPDAGIVTGLPPYALDLDHVAIDVLRDGFLAGLQNWLEPGHAYADLAGLLSGEVHGRIPEDQMRARLKALKHAPALPAQVLPRDRIFTVESDDDHLIPPPVRVALRTVLRPVRAYRFTAASHFPYVTRPAAYTALLREVLGLAPVGAVWPEGGESRM
ncbi:alpha/beta fold hydrolase [Marimonas arenosa]|uniref:Maspardin n=1 Tax=Marimonas arenosa TaxID=1795305 RepID=A0AAE3WE55_9RHOB|nr:alpha/beta hydrolase [Marimonas arenosa]MDQ2090062.1 alpha/beta hydrolase [Marimonas arenosa]